MCCTRLAGNTRHKTSPFWHHRTTLSGYIFVTKPYVDNRKKLLYNNTSSTCPDNMVNFGLLRAEICWRVWGTRANFNVFRVLPALGPTARQSSSGPEPNFAGRPSHWALAHTSSFYLLLPFSSPNLSGRRLDVCNTSTRHSSSGRQPSFAALNRGRHQY